jgi:hypothetical protein
MFRRKISPPFSGWYTKTTSRLYLLVSFLGLPLNPVDRILRNNMFKKGTKYKNVLHKDAPQRKSEGQKLQAHEAECRGSQSRTQMERVGT